ncbi:class I SAM-dependent methyltransferase [Helicobacter sp. XJK30-2]|uniref:Class I SAM-dependent methyltransferase n=1 Tax=Helicobacter zhangjianzhongii TaxID=2974574 RepID=A0ACC6FPY8_9HELI|nr:methyltransferase domain-containing protein [Helicobacter sp. XJK30-2]MDL0081294.1 class I SAM-dependent methyltransferase [Helicobacter sp. XJK30-2]
MHYAKCFVFDISNKEPVANVSKIYDEKELFAQSFDLIICSHMLEHVSYPMEFMKKFLALMHKDSLLYIEVPFAEFGWREDSDGAKLIHEHINMFKKETFIEMGKVLGLEIIVCEIFSTSKRFGCPKSIRFLAKKVES